MKGILVLLVFLVCPLAQGEDVSAFLQQGDTAAQADRHQAAIESYERAIQLQPDIRNSVLPKLARQYLWNDNPGKAVELLKEVMRDHREDCDSRLILALAFSNLNRLGDSKRNYSEVAEQCPALAAEARFGEARLLRWMDRPSRADVIYRGLAQNGTAAQKRDAQTGLALTQLARDNNRAASGMFAALSSAGAPDAAVIEAQAVSATHLGLPGRALEVLRHANEAGMKNVRLDDLNDHVRRSDDFALSPSFEAFQDADGTRYESEDLDAGAGWDKRGRAGIHIGSSTLRSDGQKIEGRWGGIDIEQRFNESFALRGDARVNDFIGADFRPFTGEFDAVLTPSDSLRVDAAVARILISDNVAAMRHRLIGTYASLGIDQRWHDQNTVSAALDTTSWSEGNTRMRYRFGLAHRFEGAPRLTIEWPTMFQTYDKGFSFGLFSPRSYVETGPGFNVSRRYARYWNVSLYARMGGQRESGAGWQKLGTFRATVERELWKSYAMQAAVGYSSSNLASPTGFTRKSFSFGVTRRF